MSAKPVTRPVGTAAVLSLGLLLTAGTASPAAAKAPLPVVLLFPATPGDITALVDLRTRLRLDGQVSVLTYDPESAAIQRVAAEASHPEWLVSAPPKDDDRLILARALGVAFYAVVSPGRTSDTTHVELVETAVSARTFDWSGTNRQFGVRAIESQVADSLAHPVIVEAANAPMPAVSTPVPAVSTPAVTPTAPISIKLPTPLTVPIAKPTAPPRPVPAVKTPTLPLSLPETPVATAQPVTPPVSKPAAKPAPVSVAQKPPAPVTLPLVQIAQAFPVTLPPIVQSAPVQSAPVQSAPVQSAPVQSAPVPRPTPRAAVPVAVPTPTGPINDLSAKISRPADGILLARPLPSTPQTLTTTPAPPVSGAGGPRLTLPTTGTQMAMLPRPKAYVPEPDTLSVLPSPPSPTAPTVIPKPRPEDLTAIKPLLAKGDAALDGGDYVGAISYFRQAVNGAPLSVVPRLKLAQAYEKNGLSSKALDEARRALEIAPDSPPVQQLLTDLDQENGTSDGTLIRCRAMVERSPDDPTVHVALADALWNSGDLDTAETEYKAAKALSPSGDHAADAQLARLYATEARYADALGALQNAGAGGYALAIKIVKNRSDTLSSTLDASREAFDGGKSTREQFYDDAKKLSAQAQALADFVAKVTPPARYKLSHLHRMLSTNLLAQEAATLVTFIETSDHTQQGSVAALEKAAATEMLTAQATEEKLGLWTGKKTE